jgi:MinD-like ATPase involved in chromosome partitioning or flagellar assembly
VTIRVLTGLDHRVEADIVQTLESDPEAVVVRRCPDVADLLAAAAAGLADVAVVSAGQRFLDKEALAALGRDQVAVVGVARDETDERALRQLGIAYVVPAEVDPAVLRDALTDATGMFDPAGPRHDDEPNAVATPGGSVRSGSVLAVWGPIGSPGRTTVAIALAEQLAGDHEVVLVDADTWGASIAQALAVIDEAPGMVAAARAAEQGTLDRPTLARLAPRAPGGFRVLTGLPRSDRWPEVRAAAFADVLRVARTIADVVVVDVGFALEDDEELSYDTSAPRRNGVTLTALEDCDVLLAVGAADPVGLQRLVRGVQEISARPAPEPLVVVNKVRDTAVGSQPERMISEALARFSGLEDLQFLPWDPQTTDAALLEGSPVTSLGRRSPLTPALEGLARRVAARIAG